MSVAATGVLFGKDCQQCGTLFSVIPSRKVASKFCSRPCYWAHGASPETKEKLSKAKKENPVRYWSGKKRPEIGGENSYNWISDRTSLKVDRLQAYDVRYRVWMKSVKDRDGWKCKISNGDCAGRLEAHHILSWRDNPELRYEVNNGITLCALHHPRKREEETRLSPYFQSLLVNET